FAQRPHALTQISAGDRARRWRPARRWRRRRNHGSWGRSRLRAVLGRDRHIGAVAARHVTAVLVVIIATRPRLPLGRDDGAGGSPAAAAEYTAKDCPGGAAENRAADRILRGCLLHRHGSRNG